MFSVLKSANKGSFPTNRLIKSNIYVQKCILQPFLSLIVRDMCFRKYMRKRFWRKISLINVSTTLEDNLAILTAQVRNCHKIQWFFLNCYSYCILEKLCYILCLSKGNRYTVNKYAKIIKEYKNRGAEHLIINIWEKNRKGYEWKKFNFVSLYTCS